MKRKYGIWLAIAVFLALMALPLLTGAEDTYADSNVIEVSTLAELRSAVQKEGAYIVLKNDITSADKYTLEIKKDYVTLNLNGYTLNRNRLSKKRQRTDPGGAWRRHAHAHRQQPG